MTVEQWNEYQQRKFYFMLNNLKLFNLELPNNGNI